MAACAHRPEDGCLLIPCFRYQDGRRRECDCAAEVRAELLENRVARVPDSARIENGEHG